MSKIVINGEAFEYDGDLHPLHEALWIEHVYKRNYGQWQDDMLTGSAKAIVMLACLIWRRDGRDVTTAYEDILNGKIEFDLAGLLRSLGDAWEASQKEAAAVDPMIPGAPPGPAGSPTTGSAISGSSPSTSGSGRGKSGSSKSRTSRP